MSENETDQSSSRSRPHKRTPEAPALTDSGSGPLRHSQWAVIYCPRCKDNRRPDSEEMDGSITCPECCYTFKCKKCGRNLASNFARIAEQREVGGVGDWSFKCPNPDCGYGMNPPGPGRPPSHQVDERKAGAETSPPLNPDGWIRLNDAAKKYDFPKGTLSKWTKSSKGEDPIIKSRRVKPRWVDLWEADVKKQWNRFKAIRRAPPRGSLNRDPTERP